MAQTTDYIKLSKIAGVLYLIIIICGISSELFVRAPIIDYESSVSTLKNITTSLPLYHLGFVLDLVMLLSDVALAVIFYKLFQPVNQLLSLNALVYRVVHAIIVTIALLFSYFASVIVLNNALPITQTTYLMRLFLDIHSYGYDLGLIFFSVSNGIIGVLILRSFNLPKILGYGLILASLVYLAGSFIHFLFPAFLSFIEVAYLIPFIAETSFALWLLFLNERYQKNFQTLND
ncbi:DUF4386 domain-containing protein [Sulfurimonas marina]|uniref:DUF4386 domain-containing protein n=1 Tax=Sulfurimonas marina TaxID=2590551 RepID=A0A7M1AWA5_9BACT|nr:DUF4386 domain-containing protein [Sulfurimonas marina]QOP41739.1 DUF4386 domain-containing protein [Sulfurimonas marina]